MPGGFKKCAFLGCQLTKRDNKTVRFFKFPVNNPEICDVWVTNCANVGLTDLTASALSSRVVCERHFEKSCFASSSPKSRLKKDAVPTIFLIDEPATTTPQRHLDEETSPTESAVVESPLPQATHHTFTPPPQASYHTLTPPPQATHHRFTPPPQASYQTFTPPLQASYHTFTPPPQASYHTLTPPPQVSYHTLTPPSQVSYHTLTPPPQASYHTLTPPPQASFRTLIPPPQASQHTPTPHPRPSIQFLQHNLEPDAIPGTSSSFPFTTSISQPTKKQKITESCLLSRNTETTPKRKQLNVVTKNIASPDTPRKIKLRKRLQKSQRTLRRKSDELRRKAKKKLTKEAAFTAASQHIKSDTFRLLLGMQMLHKQNTQWKEEEKQLAIELHYRSPALYQTFIVDKGFTLPSTRTISSWLSVLDLMPGLSEDLLEKLKLKVKTMNKLERNVVVMFDEITIKKCLSFNEKRDIIEGFQDFGSFGRSPSVGNHILMFVVRGIFSKWRMPVAHYVSSGVTEGSMLVNIIRSVIKALLQIGLNVRVLVCDQGKNNAKAVSLLKVTKENPSFTMENQRIFVVYDVPHLMKSVRNNILKDDIHFDGGKASWKHIVDLYNIDVSASKARSLCKLTNKHIAPNSFDKMKVSLATQVFSHSVKAAMLTSVDTRQMPPEAAETARFCGELNDIFDCLNSRLKVDPNPLKSAISTTTDQGKAVLEKLENAVPWIQSWKKIVPKKTKGKSTTRVTRPPSFFGFEHSINAIVKLWEDLSKEKEIAYLLTNRLTQDAIEHEFSICRHKGGFVRNPSALQFRQNLRHRLQVALMIPPSNSNCEVDVVEEIPTSSLKKDYDVEEICDTEEEDDSVSQTSSDLQFDDILVEDDEDESDCDDPMPLENPPAGAVAVDVEKSTKSTLETCSVQYVAGYLAKVCQSKYQCQACQDDLTVDTVLSEENELLILHKSYATRDYVSHLTAPSQSMVAVTDLALSTFAEKFPQIQHLPHIKTTIVDCVLEEVAKKFPEWLRKSTDCNIHRVFLINFIIRLKVVKTTLWVSREMKTPGTKTQKVKNVSSV